MKKIFKLLLCLLCLVTMVACGKPVETTKTTIIDSSGTEIVLPEKIEKVASTSNPCTNMLIALEQGDKLVASYRTIFDNPWFKVFYKNADKLTILKSYQPEVESLIAMGVDVIFVPTPEWAAAIREKGVCAICIRFYTPDEIKESVKILGQIFGKKATEKGNMWCDFLDNTIKDVESKWKNVKEEDKLVAYEIIGDKYRGLFRTNYGMGQAWLQYGGGIIATKDFGDYNSAKPTEEEILETNPDIIFIGGTYCSQLEKDLYADKKWEKINAVVNKNVHLVPVGACYWNDCSVEYPLMVYFVYSCLFPTQTDYNIKNIAKDFYKQYYNMDFNDEDMNNMLNALSPLGEEICKDLIK